MKPDTLDDPEVWARLTTALNKFMKGNRQSTRRTWKWDDVTYL
jgi:hypothetical protein